MLRVTVEIVPFGIEERKRTIGKLEIGLQGVSEHGIGHYISRLETDGRGPNQPIRDVAAVENPRHLGAYTLIQRCIDEHWRE